MLKVETVKVPVAWVHVCVEPFLLHLVTNSRFSLVVAQAATVVVVALLLPLRPTSLW